MLKERIKKSEHLLLGVHLWAIGREDIQWTANP
jgi:hypothetical protein